MQSRRPGEAHDALRGPRTAVHGQRMTAAALLAARGRASKECVLPSMPRAWMPYISFDSSVLMVPMKSMPHTAMTSAAA
jgi:hypothetical protein